MEKRKNIYLQKFNQKFVKHPFFGYIVLALILILVTVLSGKGVSLGGIILPYTKLSSFYTSFVWYIAALGFALLLGFSGLASLGTAAFVGLGAYITYEGFKRGIPFIGSFAIVLALSIALGLIVGFISLRVEGMFLAIITLGIAELIIKLSTTIWSTGSLALDPNQLRFFGKEIARNDYRIAILIVIIMLILMMLTHNLMNSPVGRGMLAMKNSPSAASAMGVNILKYKIIAFVFATVFAMLTGTLYMLFNRQVESIYWGLDKSLLLLAAVVVGGSKSIWGILIGTVFMFSFDSLLKLSETLRAIAWLPPILSGIILILVVTQYPLGLSGLRYDIKKLYYKIKRKIQIKRGVIEDEKDK